MNDSHNGHRNRIRQKIQNNGMEGLTDHELLEWVLFHTVPRVDVNPIVERLLYQFGNLYGVLKAPPKELMKIKGVGEVTATFLSGFQVVEERYQLAKKKENMRYFRDMMDITGYLKVAFVSKPRENLHALFLNEELHMIRDEIIAKGSRGQVDVNLRKLADLCMETKASAVVLAHNHPSNRLRPSPQDVHQTFQVAELLMGIKVKLLDHFIVGTHDIYSMRESHEHGYLFA